MSPQGWISPWAIYDSDEARYLIKDYRTGSPAPTWEFPAESGTVLLAASEADVNGDIAASVDHSSGIILNNRVYNDYGTLVSGQEYKAGYFRYNVRSTTPSNPTAEVTGLEGVAASYIADEALTFRGGYFRTYINADATSTMRTAIGCEMSARASQSGGTECVAEAGTAFVGARIWMAPYFSDASIGNINNFHALWILNEAAGKFVTNAIKIDATTYGSGFTYAFNADSGKFRLALDGSAAGSGLVAGETVTTSGDDWLYLQADDYRTLTTGQTYRAAYFRYNLRSTTPSNPTSEVTGVEGVAATYVTDEAITFRGGHFRTYINADATSTMRTAVGADISARASQSGGTECVAEAGTAFVGARIWMAPWFTSGSVGNINNFWGLWIYGEHTSQRNADAAIYISDAGGGFTQGIRINHTMTPDATRTNAALTLGSRVTEKDITISAAADQNLDPFQINLNIIGANPTNTSTINGIYQKITHDTTAMANLRVKCADWYVVIGANATDAYVYQGELDITAASTLSGEAICMSALVDLGADITADRVCAFQAMISGSGVAGIVTGDCFVAYIVNAGTVITTDSILNVRNQSAATAISALELELDGTVTYAVDFQGTVADGWASGDGAVTQADEYVKIPVRVAGITPTLYLLAAETWA